METTIRSIRILALAFCATVGVAHGQAVITNGSFESGFSGWSVSGSADIAQYNSSDGTNSVRFNSAEATPSGVLSQTFPVVPGERYCLTFDFGSWSELGDSQQRLSVEVSGGGTLLSEVVIADGKRGIMDMATRTFYFLADATTCTLTFRDVSLQTSSTDSHLDNVRIGKVAAVLGIRVSQVEFCWQSMTNQLWQVQYRSALTSNTWVDLGSPVPGSGPVTCYQDAISVGTPQRFYRVLLIE